MLAQVPPEWRCLSATAVDTGMRRGELVALQKGGNPRYEELGGGRYELRPYLVRAMRERPSGGALARMA